MSVSERNQRKYMIKEEIHYSARPGYPQSIRNSLILYNFTVEIDCSLK